MTVDVAFGETTAAVTSDVTTTVAFTVYEVSSTVFCLLAGVGFGEMLALGWFEDVSRLRVVNGVGAVVEVEAVGGLDKTVKGIITVVSGKMGE